MASKRIINIGLDFDGVITYNPLRIARPAVAFVKHQILGVKKIGFFVPRNWWQKIIYTLIIVKPSIWPSNGVELLKTMADNPKYKFFLITGRYSFVREKTEEWLKCYGLRSIFREVIQNNKEEQAHVFKKRVLEKYQFDFFIEDNWDIVYYLKDKVKTKILWIYNLMDRNRNYPYKYPYLQKALEMIQNETSS